MLNERELAACLAAMPGYVTAVAANRRIVWLSRCGYGYRPEDVIGADSAGFVAEADRPLWLSLLDRAFGGGETAEYVVRTLTPQGEALTVGFMAPVVIDGAVKYAVCRTMDATHRPPGSCAACQQAGGAPQADPEIVAAVILPEAPPPALPGPPARPPWREFSPTCEAALKVLGGSNGGWLSSCRIAEVIGAADTDRLKAVLTDLADRGVVEAQPGRGYRLAPAAAAFLAALEGASQVGTDPLDCPGGGR